MYKNFTLTESEREEILNRHKEHGYKQPIDEDNFNGNDMVNNENFKNDYYFKKFSTHQHRFERMADDLMDGVDGNTLDEKWNNYLSQMKNKNHKFNTTIGTEITNDIYGRVLDYPLAEGNSIDDATGIAIVTLMKMGRDNNNIKIVKLMNISKRYYGNNNDFKVFTTKKNNSNEQPIDELTLGMGDPNFGQSHKTKYSPEQQYEMNTIEELVNDAVGDSLGNDSLKSIIEDIQADYLNDNMNGGDVYDYVNEYLKDWVREARSASPSGHESGSRLTRDENNTIWGSDWESVIDRATQKPEPDDDQIMNGFGREGGISYGSSSGMNEAKEIMRNNFKRFL